MRPGSPAPASGRPHTPLWNSKDAYGGLLAASSELLALNGASRPEELSLPRFPPCARFLDRVYSATLSQELNEQKDALLSKVATLKKELQDWRGKLDTQVKTYRSVSLGLATELSCHRVTLCNPQVMPCAIMSHSAASMHRASLGVAVLHRKSVTFEKH